MRKKKVSQCSKTNASLFLHLVGAGHPLQRVAGEAALLQGTEVLLERVRHLVEKVNQGVAEVAGAGRCGVELVLAAPEGREIKTVSLKETKTNREPIAT